MSTCKLINRCVIKLSGNDSKNFINNLVSNSTIDTENSLKYALLLSPQGKFLFDLYIFTIKGYTYIDVAVEFVENFIKKLSLYKLRSDVTIEKSGMSIYFSRSQSNSVLSFTDPRIPDFGYRIYHDADIADTSYDLYESLRVKYTLPEFGYELIQDKTFPLEVGMDSLNAVDFKKGCYVGQEVTARSKYRGVIRKALYSIDSLGLNKGDVVLNQDNNEVGTITSVFENSAIAIIKDVDTNIVTLFVNQKEVKFKKASWYKNEVI